MKDDRELLLYVDLHGHSRKKNLFCYGNSNKNDPFSKEKVFPFMLEKNASIFNYADCSFAV
jgi:cytosolic carboxypeptidase protein 2/3